MRSLRITKIWYYYKIYKKNTKILLPQIILSQTDHKKKTLNFIMRHLAFTKSIKIIKVERTTVKHPCWMLDVGPGTLCASLRATRSGHLVGISTDSWASGITSPEIMSPRFLSQSQLTGEKHIICIFIYSTNL